MNTELIQMIGELGVNAQSMFITYCICWVTRDVGIAVAVCGGAVVITKKIAGSILKAKEIEFFPHDALPTRLEDVVQALQ
jgi:hypothetical protein